MKTSAKDLRVHPIPPEEGNAFMRDTHYSGTVVRNSQLHLGVFLGKHLEGVMQFGPAFHKLQMVKLVEGTDWNGFIELNRLAFTDALPRNSESRALSYAFKIFRKRYEHIDWIVSFADGTQCGDGTIYRASGFALTGITKSINVVRLPSGRTVHAVTLKTGPTTPRPELGGRSFFDVTGGTTNMAGYLRETGGVNVPGFQLRYVKFLKPECRARLTVPEMPFSAIAEAGATMYKGERPTRLKQATDGNHPDSGGAAPTQALQHTAD